MILVTGGAGFIGANFVLDWFAGCNEPVVNLDKLTYAGNLSNLASLEGDERHVFVHGDICDSRLVLDLLNKFRPRAIVHLAAESHVDRSIRDPAIFIETNINGTFTLLEAARSYCSTLAPGERSGFRFLHVSTDEVYGSLGASDPAFTERTAFAPNSPYSASKAAADHLVRAYHRMYGLPTLTTHCSNNYGPFQYPEKLIPLMIANAVSGKPLPVYGDGNQVRDWLYVSDHCAAIRCVLDGGTPGEVYNVGGGCEKTNIEIVHILCDILDRLIPRQTSYRAQIRHVQDRPGHDRRYAIDSSKLERELGWTPIESFETGMVKTVAWNLNHRDWVAAMAGKEVADHA
ncbi:dTDP-glucose 4,6-dehydratase [Massilia sp. PAMC28688]|uniref:dTDP-glucose 4,6-dehydratase n=1 Tax=Massilia sp. PAMC28688 TaxID=2861283 RepID=UPI001C634BFA|nr:dTDP-glucose 4,6-dehydratase [Massilia sp. PAMC28688]QYF91633.1 dTDP-glucose 4,6-dehydratase [Massilia sp. PAMC28688]